MCTRINRLWADRIRWTSAAELASYATAAQATRMHLHGLEQRLHVSAPFPCRSFTLQLPSATVPQTISVDGVLLSQIPEGTPLAEGCWRPSGPTAALCFDLHDGLELTWQ